MSREKWEMSYRMRPELSDDRHFAHKIVQLFLVHIFCSYLFDCYIQTSPLSFVYHSKRASAYFDHILQFFERNLSYHVRSDRCQLDTLLTIEFLASPKLIVVRSIWVNCLSQIPAGLVFFLYATMKIAIIIANIKMDAVVRPMMNWIWSSSGTTWKFRENSGKVRHNIS